MAINMSPGVFIKERNLSDIVRGVASSSAGIVGYSAKGSVDDLILITNNQEFIAQYGEPDPSTGHFFHYAALEYLRAGNTLWCYRVANAPLYAGMDVTKLTSLQLPAAWSVGHSDADFDLGAGIAETSALGWDDDITAIGVALNLLPSILAIGGVVMGGDDMTTLTGMTVTFLPAADNVDPIVPDIVSLTGPTVIDVVESTEGDDGGVAEVVFQVTSVNPGVWNNRIAVFVEDTKDGTDPIPTDQYTFTIRVRWQDDDGNWSDVESFKVSRKHKIDGFGRNLFMEEVINGRSEYIRVSDSAMADTVMPQVTVAQVVLAGGSDGSAITSAEPVLGWDKFANPAEVDVRMLICGGETATAVQLKMQAIAEARFDCVALLDMDYDASLSVTDSVTWRNDTLSINSSYCVLDSPWPLKLDPYNDRLINMPPSGFRAQALAYTDAIGHPWDAAAGFTRGQLNVSSLKPIFTQAHRNTLSANQINAFQDFGGEGNVIWHQLTMDKKASALQDLNVRRLLIQVEKSLAIALRRFIFEPNNDLTRFRVEAIINEYMEMLAGQGAFQQEGDDQGFHVVCDRTNNTPAKIDRNILAVDVFIKPVRVIYYVNLQVTVTKTGTSFEELIARGVTF